MVKLYDLDAYATEFDAKVVSCEAVTYNKQDVYAVILDRTLFFPEEGGQSPDKGTLDGKTVLDAQIKKDIVTHYLEQPVEAGATVHGVIDWKHRFSNMQQHSGEHIFSGIVHRDYGFNNVGFHLSDNIVTMDFDGVLSAEQIADVDSKNLCTAMGLLVLKACDFRDKGMDAKKIADKVTRLVPKVSATFVLDSLEYLHKGGRCSGVARFGANMLGIKPSIAVDKDGKMDVAKKYRGKMDAVYKQYAADCLAAAGKADASRMVIANSGGIEPSNLAFIKGLAQGSGKFEKIILADAGCTISSHCGPKTLAIFYINK